MSGTRAQDRPVGILMLDTRFPRLPGDVGNPASFDCPVLYETLVGVGPQMAVRDAPSTPGLVDVLAAAAGRLVARGAVVISTSCGFLALFQRELAARCAVPVATSSLLLVPRIEAALPPGRRVGVLTAEARSLTAEHFLACGARPDTPFEGMPPGGAFARTFLDNGPTIDAPAVERETIEAAQRLQARHPDLGAIVLECTNLPPYAAALHRTLRIPIFDVRDLLIGLKSGLHPSSLGGR